MTTNGDRALYASKSDQELRALEKDGSLSAAAWQTEGRFRIEAMSALSTEDEILSVLSILMVLLLERGRG